MIDFFFLKVWTENTCVHCTREHIIHSKIQYFLKAYYIPGTRYMAVNEIDKLSYSFHLVRKKGE